MDDKDRYALIGQMFALITGKFEDGAGLAIDGHKPKDTDDVAARSASLRCYAEEIIALLDAVEVIRQPES
jgi:hypothetical protein